MNGLGEDDAEASVGYYRVLFLSALADDSANSILADYVKDGNIDWQDSEVTEIDLDSNKEEVRSKCVGPSGIGIWWASGRVLFPNH